MCLFLSFDDMIKKR